LWIGVESTVSSAGEAWCIYQDASGWRVGMAQKSAGVWSAPVVAGSASGECHGVASGLILGTTASNARAAGVVAGGIAQLALQVPALMRIGMLPRIAFDPRPALADPAVRRIMRNMVPAVLAVSVAQVSLIINTHIASRLGAGAVSWVSFGDRLMEFPTALLGVALGTVLLPSLSRANATGRADEYSALLDWGLRLTALLALPCMVGLGLMAEPLTDDLATGADLDQLPLGNQFNFATQRTIQSHHIDFNRITLGFAMAHRLDVDVRIRQRSRQRRANNLEHGGVERHAPAMHLRDLDLMVIDARNDVRPVDVGRKLYLRKPDHVRAFAHVANRDGTPTFAGRKNILPRLGTGRAPG
jgi:hypothetical protein